MVRVFHMRHPEHTGRWATAEQLGELKQTLRGIHQAQVKLGTISHLRVEFSHLQRWINKRLGGSGSTTAPHRPTKNLPNQPTKLTHSEIMSKLWNHPTLGHEMKQLHSTFMLNWWADPELGIERRERQRQFMLAWWWDPVLGMERRQAKSEWNDKWYNDPILGPIRRKEVSDRETIKWGGEVGMKRRAEQSRKMTVRYSGEDGQKLREKKRKENDAYWKDEVHGEARMESRNATAAANRGPKIDKALFKRGGTWTEQTHIKFDQAWFQSGNGKCPDMSTFPYNELLYFLPKAFNFLFPGVAVPLDFPFPEETETRPYTKRPKSPWKYDSPFTHGNGQEFNKDTIPVHVSNRALLDHDPMKHRSRYISALHDLSPIAGVVKCRFNSWVGMYKFSEELLKHAKAQDIPGTANIVVTSLTSYWTKV